ncbi:MAG: hypothetical protein CBC54_004965 [Rhizobiales bacterium TMED94]|nr:hypothetical protein [Rhodobiaceae bacterium]RPF86626.1 MAG: hypothetical protein CBC54_004965 [Rhizobiales bacterium TMED94]|tara:strand:- start:1801 stop:2106 length:306 start_codon:yes stop_codon:yes gene_type:complete
MSSNYNKLLIISFFIIVVSSCSTVERINESISGVLKPSQKETPDVAGKLVCAAAGIETEECVEAVKTKNDDSTEDELEIINNDNNPNIESLELNQDESLLK